MDLPSLCRAVRDRAGVFVPEDLGVLAVSGEDRLSWLNGMVTNDVAKLPPGGRLEACFVSVKGKLLALADVWRREDRLHVVTARDRIPVLREVLERLIVMEDVVLGDESDAWTLVTVQGPAAAAVCASAGVLGAASDRSGSGGVDLLVERAAVDAVVARLAAAGAVRGTDEALDALRLEAALPVWGKDVTEDLFPQEARIEGQRVSFTKGCYVGQEPVVRLQSRGHANRFLAPIDLGDAEPPPRGAPVRVGDAEVGHVTSAGRGPTVGRTIALALVRREASAPGMALVVDGRPARVVERPWVEAP
jgi:folate-binding protein YgfZ